MVLIYEVYYMYSTDDGGFRPLAGIMVLIPVEYDVPVGELAAVSVPLRGLWFLSHPWKLLK